jgi:hypothetical protein
MGRVTRTSPGPIFPLCATQRDPAQRGKINERKKKDICIRIYQKIYINAVKNRQQSMRENGSMQTQRYKHLLPTKAITAKADFLHGGTKIL